MNMTLDQAQEGDRDIGDISDSNVLGAKPGKFKMVVIGPPAHIRWAGLKNTLRNGVSEFDGEVKVRECKKSIKSPRHT